MEQIKLQSRHTKHLDLTKGKERLATVLRNFIYTRNY